MTNPTEPQGDGQIPDWAHGLKPMTADKVMTREEYDALHLKGWHCVRHDHEIPFTTEIIYGVPIVASPAVPEQFAKNAKNSPEQEGGDVAGLEPGDLEWLQAQKAAYPGSESHGFDKHNARIDRLIARLTPKPSEEQCASNPGELDASNSEEQWERVARAEAVEVVAAWLVGIACRTKAQAKTFTDDAADIVDAVLSLPQERIAEGWRPKETAPKDLTVVLVGRAGREVTLGITCESGVELLLGEDIAEWGDDQPTHWMPRPSPPASDGGA